MRYALLLNKKQAHRGGPILFAQYHYTDALYSLVFIQLKLCLQIVPL